MIQYVACPLRKLTNPSEAHQSAEPEDQTLESSISNGKASLSIEENIALLQEEVKRVASRSTPVQQQRSQEYYFQIFLLSGGN